MYIWRQNYKKKSNSRLFFTKKRQKLIFPGIIKHNSEGGLREIICNTVTCNTPYNYASHIIVLQMKNGAMVMNKT